MISLYPVLFIINTITLIIYSLVWCGFSMERKGRIDELQRIETSIEQNGRAGVDYTYHASNVKRYRLLLEKEKIK
jgi:hypothetical protein